MRTVPTIATTAGAVAVMLTAPGPGTAAGARAPLSIVGTPVVAYRERHHPDGARYKHVVYSFETNFRIRSQWEVRLSGMMPLFVNRGSSKTCYQGELGVGRNEDAIYDVLRPGHLITLEVRGFKPRRRAHRGVRAYRAASIRDLWAVANTACGR